MGVMFQDIEQTLHDICRTKFFRPTSSCFYLAWPQVPFSQWYQSLSGFAVAPGRCPYFAFVIADGDTNIYLSYVYDQQDTHL